MSLQGWYYLHVNGSLIYKPDPDACGDVRESDFARGLWPFDPLDRAGAWRIVVEGLAAGAKPARVAELASNWGCTDGDAPHYANHINCLLSRDGNAWCATRADFIDLVQSPAGFGDTAVTAFANLAQQLGYKPSKMWGATFAYLLADKAGGAG